MDKIPDETIDDVHVTQVLLTESLMETELYGDMTFNAIDAGVDIQIFYSVDFTDDMQLAEIKLMKRLEDENWRTVNSEPHYLDLSQTDEQQMIKNIEVRKVIEIDI